MTDFLSALRWWAALTMLGLAALPLVHTLLRPLPDRGYAFVKMAGLLLVSTVFWLAGSLGFAGNDGGGITLALVVVGALSLLAYRRRAPGDEALGDWLRANWRTVLAAELVFAAVFALWVWVRAQNPAIANTEKPMEFAFLNGVTLSPSFPPLDPWLSGYGISYYYFGYVMTSLLARLAVVPTAVAFNLAVAWLVAGAAVGAFGVVYNLVAGRGIRNGEQGTGGAGEQGRSHSPLTTRAILLGLIAALAVPIAGNLQIGLEVLHGNGVGSDGFWQWLDVRDINGPADTDGSPRYLSSEWWWWRTSRVIHEYTLSGRAEEGLEPIVEAPAFSYILGDLHPHVLALPFAFLSLGVALAWWMGIRNEEAHAKAQRGKGREEESHAKAQSSQSLRSFAALLENSSIGWPLWLFTAVVLGGLSFLNTWDVLIHLFVVLGAFFLGLWHRQGHTRGLWGRTALLAVSLVVPAALIYLPFYLGFRSQAGPPFLLPMLMRPTRLAHFAIIFGLPLTAISVMLVSLAARRRFRHWRTGLGVAAVVVGGLLVLMVLLLWVVAVAQPGGGMVGGLVNELGLTLPARPEGALALGWGVRAVAAVLPVWLAARLASPWLLLLLVGLLALAVMALRAGVEENNPQITQISQIEEQSVRIVPAQGQRTLPFALLLILTGVLLTLGPEFVYLRDNFGVRLNTTFKFYYQAWAMFGVAAVFALDYLLSMRHNTAERLVGGAATVGYVALLAVSVLFPVYAVQSRALEYRGAATDAAGQPQERQPATLDGLASLRRFNPSEYEALRWLLENAVRPGETPPVVLEAVGGQYSAFGRVAANTGLPTVLGWPGHEWQWRGSDHPEPGRREGMVEQIYTATNLNTVAPLLDELGVSYIYVGDLEAGTYGAAGLEKFRDRLEVAFANDRVTIYRWQPASSG
jgi:YYY domain-containing protein